MRNLFIIALFSINLIFLSKVVIAATCASGSGTCGEATVYKVTMTKLELCTAAPLSSESDVTCTGAYVVGNTTKTFDIASVNAGAAVGSWIDTTGLPIGTTYTHIKPTFNKTFTLKGEVEISSGGLGGSLTCYTDEDATTGSNNVYAAIAPGKVSGTATEQELSMFTDGTVAVCNTASTNTCAASQNQSWTKDLVNDTANYGSALANTATSVDTTSMIYALTSPYTVGITAPKISIKFGVSTAIEAKQDPDGDNNGCNIFPYYPKVNVSITE